jgi:apolipoprotein N-acyltransferase
VIATARLGERNVVDGLLPLSIEPTVFVTTNGLVHLVFPLVFLSLVLLGRARV